MIKRIGLLTSGGDCQALNATMRGVVKGLSNSVENLEVYGFDDSQDRAYSKSVSWPQPCPVPSHPEPASV